LQVLLGELFALSGLSLTRVRTYFRALEATFALVQNDYCLWVTWDSITTVEALDRFLASLGHRKDFGLFLSLMGFAPDALSAHSRGRPPFVLMDGADLMAVLDGRVGLAELILRKRRYAEETGNVFLQVQEVLKAGPSSS
jgi:hypothetical protein